MKAGRSRLGMTQEGLAAIMRQVGHSWRQTTVAKTEAAERPLRVNELVDLSGALRVPLTDLLESDPLGVAEMRTVGELIDAQADESRAARALKDAEFAAQEAQHRYREARDRSQLVNEEFERIRSERIASGQAEVRADNFRELARRASGGK